VRMEGRGKQDSPFSGEAPRKCRGSFRSGREYDKIGKDLCFPI